MQRNGKQLTVRYWTVHLYYLPRCPSERADRSGWYAYAEHRNGAMVPPRPLPDRDRDVARAMFYRLVELVR